MRTENECHIERKPIAGVKPGDALGTLRFEPLDSQSGDRTEMLGIAGQYSQLMFKRSGGDKRVAHLQTVAQCKRLHQRYGAFRDSRRGAASVRPGAFPGSFSQPIVLPDFESPATTPAK
jgi:hypothetical protein